MSYCRKGRGSDVYMYPSYKGIECCGCTLDDSEPGVAIVTCWTQQEALVHLCRHIAAGHRVQKQAIRRLLSEMDENVDALVCPECGGKLRMAPAIRDMGGPGIQCVDCGEKSPRITQQDASDAVVAACLKAWNESPE